MFDIKKYLKSLFKNTNMGVESILIFNGVIFCMLAVFSISNQSKTKRIIHVAWESAKKFTPILLFIFLIILIIQNVFTEQFYINNLSVFSGIIGYIGAAAIGAIAHIPLFVAFPIGGQLIQQGVNIGFVAALITSLISVHTFSIPLEIKEMGLKFALIRNGLAFIFAIFVGIIMGLLL